MVEIVWTEDAAEDLENIVKYISKDSVQNAEMCFQKILDKVTVLENQPYSGHIVPEFNEETIRELHQFSFRIIYKIKSEFSIHILTVHHSKMLLSNNPHFDF
ncbi:MAG: type II toxin-antitoxin system RelE/ParE family toxin [Bacteroidia bacterium]